MQNIITSSEPSAIINEMKITKILPELNYFRVEDYSYGTRLCYLVASIENSLGLSALAKMNFTHTRVIAKLNINKQEDYINNKFEFFGIYLAETSLYYQCEEIDGLKHDYLTIKISNLS